MELKEAIERLEKYLSYIKKTGFKKLPNDEAIDTVLQALENSISKDKIKEKIEEIKSAQESTDKCDWQWIYKYQIDILQELLKGE